MKKNIKKKVIPVKKRKPQTAKKTTKQNVNVNVIKIDQSRKSTGSRKPSSKSSYQIPMPSIVVNPSTNIGPSTNPFSLSDVKDTIRSMLGEKINIATEQTGFNTLNQPPRNPYGFRDPGYETDSIIATTLNSKQTPKSNKTYYSLDDNIDNMSELTDYSTDFFSPISYIKSTPLSVKSNQESLMSKQSVKPEEESLGEQILNNPFVPLKEYPLLKGFKKKIEKKKYDKERNEKKKETTPVKLEDRNAKQLREQAEYLGINVYLGKRPGKGNKRYKSRLELIDEIKVKTK